jgi:hypothetical protein
MSKATVTGRIVDIQLYSKGNFTKKTVVLITDEDTSYPQYLPIEYAGKNVDIVQMYEVGDKITAEIEPQGRKWENNGEVRYFPSFRGVDAYSNSIKPKEDLGHGGMAANVNAVVESVIGQSSPPADEHLPF